MLALGPAVLERRAPGVEAVLEDVLERGEPPRAPRERGDALFVEASQYPGLGAALHGPLEDAPDDLGLVGRDYEATLLQAVPIGDPATPVLSLGGLPLEALVQPLADDAALELGQGRHDVSEELARGRGGVDVLAQEDRGDTGGAEGPVDVDHVLHGSPRPVDRGENDRAQPQVLHLGQELVQGRAFLLVPGDALFAVDPRELPLLEVGEPLDVGLRGSEAVAVPRRPFLGDTDVARGAFGITGHRAPPSGTVLPASPSWSKAKLQAVTCFPTTSWAAPCIGHEGLGVRESQLDSELWAGFGRANVRCADIGRNGCAWRDDARPGPPIGQEGARGPYGTPSGRRGRPC